MFVSKRFALLGFFVGFIALAPISISPALASAKATSVSPSATSFSTGTFIAYATASQVFTNPSAALSLPVTPNSPKTFFIESDGTLNLTALTLTITPPGGGTITRVRNCAVGVLFTGTTTCATGSPTTTNPVRATPFVYTLSLPAHTWCEFQLTESKPGSATISVSVGSTQIVTFTQNS